MQNRATTSNVVWPTIFLVVAALILNVLMTRLARQQRTTIGTLKAIGYGDLQIFFHFLQLGLVVGISGGLLGSLLGYVAAAGMTLMYRGFYEFPDLRSGFHWPIMLIGMTTSIACAVLGSLVGAWSALQLQSAEAMRPAPPTIGRHVALEKLQWFWSAQSTAWRMSWRSILRNPLRSGIGVFASAMGGALLITGLMLLDSQNYMVSFQYDLVARSDVDLALADDSTRDVLNEARKLPVVDWAEPRLDVPCTLYHGPYHEKTVVTGLVAQPQLTVPCDREGQCIAIPAHGFVLGRRMAEKLHLRLGDRVTMVPTQGDKYPVQVPVVQIAAGYSPLQVGGLFLRESMVLTVSGQSSGFQLDLDWLG